MGIIKILENTEKHKEVIKIIYNSTIQRKQLLTFWYILFKSLFQDAFVAALHIVFSLPSFST